MDRGTRRSFRPVVGRGAVRFDVMHDRGPQPGLVAPGPALPGRSWQHTRGIPKDMECMGGEALVPAA